MEKTIYEIYENKVEYRDYQFCSYEQGMTITEDESPKLIATFDSLDDAKKEFKKDFYISDVAKMQGLIGQLYHVTEYVLWRQEVDIDDDGDIDYISGDILDISDLRENYK